MYISQCIWTNLCTKNSYSWTKTVSHNVHNLKRGLTQLELHIKEGLTELDHYFLKCFNLVAGSLGVKKSVSYSL